MLLSCTKVGTLSNRGMMMMMMVMSHFWWFTLSTPITEVTVVWPQISHLQSTVPLESDAPVQTLFICLFQTIRSVVLCFQNPMSFLLWFLVGIRIFQTTPISLGQSLFHLQVKAGCLLNLHVEVSPLQIYIFFVCYDKLPLTSSEKAQIRGRQLSERDYWKTISFGILCKAPFYLQKSSQN